MSEKRTCDKESCRILRNILCDAYEILSNALDEIVSLEDADIQYPIEGHHAFVRCLAIAGNARRQAQYLIYDKVKEKEQE